MDRLAEKITQKIKIHHSIYNLPIFGELWEEILHNSFIDLGQLSYWKPNRSHGVGKDITHEKYGKISCKSGIYHIKNNTLMISGSRTSKHKTLEDKLKFLSQDHEDHYFCLARNKKEWELGKKQYYFFQFDSMKIDYSKQNWIPTNNGWKFDNCDFSGKILASASGQVWTTINSSFIGEPIKISIQG